MKTLEEQFGKLKLPKSDSKGLEECYAINNYIALKVVNYIIHNKCKLEHRSSLDSDNWKPGTFREFMHYLSSGKPDDIHAFDNWYLRFWRIKTKATYEELEALIKVQNNEED